MMASKSFVFRFDDVEVREREFTLIKAGKVLTVEPKAFRALLFLLHNPQRLISKEELLDAVWDDVAVTEGSLTRCISLLRGRLGDDTRSPRYIETVATVGYRFKCTVEVSEEVPGDLPGPERSIPEDGPVVETPTGKGLEGGLRARHRWPLAAIIIAGILATFAWYLHPPLPPPRITGYSQITHDGHQKVLVGTDGTRLYFNQMSGPSLAASIAEVAISGGGTAQVPVPIPDPLLLDVSPDGSDFLIYSDSAKLPGTTLWNVRILGGSKRRLTDLDGDSACAAFSPDGNSAAYAQQLDIYVVRSDGTEAHKLVSTGNDVCHIVWSPDGGAIRFTMKDRSWEVSSNGSGLHEVIPGWHGLSSNCCGRWTSDGKFFLFLSDGQIWALDERRGLFREPPKEPIQLTQGPIQWGGPLLGKYTAWDFLGEPIPSKDGRKIFALGLSPRGELSRFDPKTKQFQQFLGGISAQGIVFSNDGKSIAYVSYPEGTLWKADRDGSNPVQLTDPPMEAILPRWSPDSKLISFAFEYPGPDGGFYVVSADGGSPRKILPEDRNMDGFLTWAPDGHRVVSTSTSADGKRVLRILNLDTRQATTIPGSDGLFSPRWSPDGRFVAAASVVRHK
jgi:DNA-binding winged helix-turn-helix (wHTH) protein/Tol biopolymer transport system component